MDESIRLFALQTTYVYERIIVAVIVIVSHGLFSIPYVVYVSTDPSDLKHTCMEFQHIFALCYFIFSKGKQFSGAITRVFRIHVVHTFQFIMTSKKSKTCS
ncbi:hypothetical protein ACJX0J_016939 [Zea mays]